ncbi:hypothetical protein [Nocardiopsis ganjiahuensis]|uniref:hypothetical protein n=1 Tax=Nocardiopsis ganjiahuensis TaxID=239984 RepID=UPI000348E494|nr:hypothetical protein [Nocardiopsis ganjiahuensis]
MPENITPRVWHEQSVALRLDLHQALDRVLDLLTTELYGTVPSSADLFEQPPAARRDHHLARLAAIDILTEELAHQSKENAFAAARMDGAPATYADLGRAVGIGREGARSRWPGAVADAKAGRPRKQVTVRLTGGPAEWDGAEIEFDRAEVHDRALADVGGHLITPSHQIPEGLPDDARAHYAPDAEDTRTVWTFQGWVPS